MAITYLHLVKWNPEFADLVVGDERCKDASVIRVFQACSTVQGSEVQQFCPFIKLVLYPGIVRSWIGRRACMQRCADSTQTRI